MRNASDAYSACLKHNWLLNKEVCTPVLKGKLQCCINSHPSLNNSHSVAILSVV